MNSNITLITVATLCMLSCSMAAEPSIDPAKFKRIDEVVNQAIERKNCPGAVVVVIHQDQIIYRKAFGHREVEPKPVPMTLDTVFDLASLTKPIVTGTSIHLLVEQKKLKLTDTVAEYWPEFNAEGKGTITIEHCLLHTTGLIADNAITDYKNGTTQAFERIAKLKLTDPVGSKFRYSDVGFIVLGRVVEKVSGKKLDQFAKANIFDKLSMKQTGYRFDNPDNIPFAPTGIRDQKIIRGIVHDPRAYALGGVAGHAGLFGTADDLCLYCRMLIREGELDGIRILDQSTVRAFTEPHEVPNGKRSLGWDVDTAYSAQRGDKFKAGTGYGHTGFTGTSIWIDPPSKTAIIILTNRLHPDEKKGNVTSLRREIGTIVAEAVTP